MRPARRRAGAGRANETQWRSLVIGDLREQKEERRVSVLSAILDNKSGIDGELHLLLAPKNGTAVRVLQRNYTPPRALLLLYKI